MSTLMYNSFSVVAELMYIVMIADDMIEILESLSTFAISLFYTAVTYNFYMRRDKIKYIIDMLRMLTYSKIDSNDNCQLIINSAKRVKLISWLLWVFTLSATIVFMSIPFWFTNKGNAQIRPLPYHSWYPYNKNKNPYYEISFTLEFFRGIGILNIITGNDSLFAFVLFFTFGQYKILKNNFQNVYLQARRNLTMASKNVDDQELLKNEMEFLLKQNIKHHIVLNDLCSKEEDVYGPMIFIHVVLHASVLCFVGYLMMISLVCLKLVHTTER